MLENIKQGFLNARNVLFQRVLVVDALLLGRLHRCGSLYFLCGLMEVMCGMVRGRGKTWLPMFVTGVGACLSRIVWIYTIFQIHHTPEILYWSYPMSWILTLVLHSVCFLAIYRKYEKRRAACAAV